MCTYITKLVKNNYVISYKNLGLKSNVKGFYTVVIKDY